MLMMMMSMMMANVNDNDMSAASPESSDDEQLQILSSAFAETLDYLTNDGRIITYTSRADNTIFKSLNDTQILGFNKLHRAVLKAFQKDLRQWILDSKNPVSCERGLVYLAEEYDSIMFDLTAENIVTCPEQMDRAKPLIFTNTATALRQRGKVPFGLYSSRLAGWMSFEVLARILHCNSWTDAKEQVQKRLDSRAQAWHAEVIGQFRKDVIEGRPIEKRHSSLIESLRDTLGRTDRQ